MWCTQVATWALYGILPVVFYALEFPLLPSRWAFGVAVAYGVLGVLLFVMGMITSRTNPADQGVLQQGVCRVEVCRDEKKDATVEREGANPFGEPTRSVPLFPL